MAVIPCSEIATCFNANTETFVSFPNFFAYLMRQKSFVFCEFLDLEDVKFLENQNMTFENSSLKAFLRQSIRFSIFQICPAILDSDIVKAS